MIQITWRFKFKEILIALKWCMCGCVTLILAITVRRLSLRVSWLPLEWLGFWRVSQRMTEVVHRGVGQILHSLLIPLWLWVFYILKTRTFKTNAEMRHNKDNEICLGDCFLDFIANILILSEKMKPFVN